MKILRNLQAGEEIFVTTLPGFRLHLHKVGKTFEFRPPIKHRLTRKWPQLEAFYGIIVGNQDFVLVVRPTQLHSPRKLDLLHHARIPYNVLMKVLVFTGQTNEATVKNTRQIVGGSAFSSWRGFAWDNRRSTPIPLEQPHTQPASRYFEEVRIA